MLRFFQRIGRRSNFVKRFLIFTLCALTACPPAAFATTTVYPLPPIGPPPVLHDDGPGQGPIDGLGPFAGGFRGEPQYEEERPGTGRRQSPGSAAFAEQDFAGDDDFGGQGSGGSGSSLGVRGPAGADSFSGTGSNGDGNDGGSNGSAGDSGSGAGGAGGGCCWPPGSCDGPNQPDPPPPPNNPPAPPEATYDPIFMRTGSTTEVTLDLELPTPLGPWRMTRSYNSLDSVRNAFSSQGRGWLNNQADMRLTRTGPNDVELVTRGDSRIRFSRPASTAPFFGERTHLRLEHLVHDSIEEYVVTNPRTGEVWIFYQNGRLKEVTTESWRGAGKVGAIYSYNSGDVQTTTAEGQELNIVLDFDDQILMSVTVNKVTTPIMKVEYTYFADGVHDPEVGSEGDLVQVDFSRLASDGSTWVHHYTQYRYDSESRMVGIYNHDAIMSLVAHNTSIDTAEEILNYPNDAATGGKKVKDFADRLYEYHTEPAFTSGVFGEGNTPEIGMVKRGIDRPKSCGACGTGGNGGITYDYSYGAYDHGSNAGQNDIVLLVIEDISDANNTLVKRRVYGLNNWGNILRQATIQDPDTSPKYWCSSRILRSNGQVAEYRLHSAHTVVDTPYEAYQFFNPSIDTWDADTLNQDSGFIWTYMYDENDRRIASVIKQGRGATEEYLGDFESYIEYYPDTDLPYRIHSFPTQVAYSDGVPTASVYTEYAYTFWDDEAPKKTRIKTRKIIPPVVGTDQNGSGQQTALWEYYDETGRLRWTKNGEGYVTYRAYSPVTGQLAYQNRDVNTDTLLGEIENGIVGKWEGWTENDGVVPEDLTRTATSTALSLTTKQEFDDQGRVVRRAYPYGGGREGYATHLVYEQYRTIIFPYVHHTTGVPAAPITVSEWDDAHRNTAVYTVKQSVATITSNVPAGISATQADYVSLIRYNHDPVTGQVTSVDTYHDIPSSGNGTLGTNYYSTTTLYTPMGYAGATVQYVDTDRYQVNTTLFNLHDRPVEIRRGVATTAPTSYGSLDDAITSTPSGFEGYATISQIEYDGATPGGGDGIGDGYVTAIKQFHGTGTNDYVQTAFHRTFRGHLRGIQRQTSSGGVTPYTAMDLNWLGETIATARYTSAPSWATLRSGYGAYVNHSSGATARHDLAVTSVDDLGRTYRMEHYPGTSAQTNKFQRNNFYDRRDLLICTGDKYSAHTEYAYDGAGRQYQNRTVIDAASTPYVSGAFQYRAPAPKPTLSAMSTSGDDGLIEFMHSEFDASGNAVAEHSFEQNHDDANGIDIDATDSYVRRTVYQWYDAGDRPITTADFGAGDHDDGATTWKYAAVPDRPTGTSTGWTSDANRLIMQYGYNVDSGRLEAVISPAPGASPSPSTVTTKTFYDDLGRRTHVAENHENFAPPTSNIGDTTDPSKDRVTAWTYYGLGQVAKLTAHNGSSVQQVTDYFYLDDYNASLNTHTIYPDATTRTAEATWATAADQVRMEYRLDGSLHRRKDQRGVVITYSYDGADRLTLQAATNLPSDVDDAIESIGRAYDDQGRLTTITSYDGNAGSGTIQNQIKYTYHSTHGYLQKSEQSHQGAVTTGTPAVQYAHDASTTSDVFDDGLRLESTTYPATGRVIWQGYGGTGTSTNIHDRLSRTAETRETNSSGNQLVSYGYNGTSRVVETNYEIPEARLPMFNVNGGGINHYDGWDRFGRTVYHRWAPHDSMLPPLDSYYYTNDFAGNRLTRENQLSKIASPQVYLDQKYLYDGLHRLRSMSQGGLIGSAMTYLRRSEDWVLDALGNWTKFDLDTNGDYTPELQQERNHNEANEIDSIGLQPMGAGADWVDPSHDDAGNMTTIPQPGTPTSGLTLKYDAWNRLVEVKANSNTVQQNEYDGLNRRIVRSVYSSGTLSHRMHGYYNEQWQLLEERKETSGTEDPDPVSQYVWHPYYIDALAVRYWDSDADGDYLNTNEGAHFYLQDGNYNVTAVMNSSATVLERYAYSPYGEVTFLNPSDFSMKSTQESDIGNSHLFTGRERDPEMGLQLNRERFYASGLGRWLTRDPVGYADGYNLYAGYFVPNDIDPQGTDCPGCDLPDRIGANNSDCAKRCCAEHDRCFWQNGCTYWSWFWNAGGTAVGGCLGGVRGAQAGWTWIALVSPCARCNRDVAECIATCIAANGNHMQGKPMYFCPRAGRFIRIPGDFPNLAAAKRACCN